MLSVIPQVWNQKTTHPPLASQPGPPLIEYARTRRAVYRLATMSAFGGVFAETRSSKDDLPPPRTTRKDLTEGRRTTSPTSPLALNPPPPPPSDQAYATLCLKNLPPLATLTPRIHLSTAKRGNPFPLLLPFPPPTPLSTLEPGKRAKHALQKRRAHGVVLAGLACHAQPNISHLRHVF